MKDIKIKENRKGTIKTIDKGLINTQKLKDNLISIKDKSKETYENNYNSGEDYATEKITQTMSNTPNNIYRVNKAGKNNFRRTKDNIYKIKDKIHNYKRKTKIKQRVKNISKIRKNIKNNAKRTMKTAKTTVKTTQKVAKAIKTTAKATATAIKVTVKATIATVKAIILGIKALIAAIAAGGWVVVVIILVICLIAFLCSSIYGVFFSSENENGTNMSSVISELNDEFMKKITDIQNSTEHNEYEINSNRAEWKNILAIYVAKVSNGDDEVELMTLDDKRVQTLKDVFWDMNNISSKTETKDDKTILYIEVTSKTMEEMMNKYSFNDKQRQQVEELLKDEYASLWSSVIYGTSSGSQDIVQVAKQQIGNVGGQPYWSWYGFSSRVEWCACFVSWCADQCGYIDAGIIPKFANCQNEGVAWFKTVGLWKDVGYVPKSGDIIFFDWENDGISDHVGIVEKTESSTIYTIEGNTSNDVCKQNKYNIDSSDILGYGTPAY